MLKSMMSYSEMSLQFWGEALSTTTYILNRVHIKAKPLTPYEIWTGTKSDLSKLKVWGYKAYVLILKPLHNKISAKTWKYECQN